MKEIDESKPTRQAGKPGQAFAVALVAVHVGLAAWALTGYVEMVFQNVPWPRLSNPLFSSEMLLLQWTLVSVAAAVFVVGHFRRWRHLPVAMLWIYGAMALTCAYQTFFILTADGRFIAMAAEYVAYVVILVFLFTSGTMRERLSRRSLVHPTSFAARGVGG